MRYGKVVSKALFVQGYDDKIMNALLGLAGEVGEILDSFKKAKFHPNGEIDSKALRLELGDVLFYLALLNELYFGDSLTEVARDNIAKLQSRWPDRYEHVNLEELEL